MFSKGYSDTRFEQLRVKTALGTFYIERGGRAQHTDHTVVLLHGFGTNASLWRGVGSRLAHSGCQVIAPDLLGCGASEWPIGDPYTLASQAQALDAALRAMGISRATVVGQDVGGLVGLVLAARRPDMVRALVLINPPDLERLPPEPVRSMQRIADRFPAGITDNRLATTALMAALLAHSTADPAQLSSSTVVRYLAPWLASDGAAQLCRLAQALAHDAVAPEILSAVLAPTLVIRGGCDRSVPSECASTLVEALPNAVLHTFAHAGRLLGEDAPDALARTLLHLMHVFAQSEATERALHA